MKRHFAPRALVVLLILAFALAGIPAAAAAPDAPMATTVFSESMWDGTGTPSNGAAISTFESSNYFQNDSLTMTGTGDMRNTSVSSGYTTASGTWNVMLNTATQYFQITGINTTGYTNLALSFGVRKGTTAEDGSGLTVAVSSDGTNWTTLAVPALPTGTGTAIWHYRTASGTIPATANLRIKFTSSNTVEWRIDDVLLVGDLAGDAAPTVSSTSPTNGATGVAVNANLSVTFSEAVNVAAGWYAISCTSSSSHTATVTGGPTTFTLDPSPDFTASETCTVTIDKTKVTDQDSNDPPDTMAANASWSFTIAAPVATNVIINELDADQTSTDTAEFIELYDGGAGNTSLSGLVVVLYNGSNDLSYAAFDLDGRSTDATGYFVICGNAANVVNCDWDVTPDTDLIQNGADAVALYTANGSDFPNNTGVTTSNLLDAIVYDTGQADDAGLLPLLNSGQPQVNENANSSGETQSNQRCPNGSGGQRNTLTYAQNTPTPGAANTCPPPAGVCGDPATLIHAIQGSGTTSPLSGPQTIEGVVVGDFEVNGLKGYFVQEEDAQADTDPLTSEGIFIYDGNTTNEVASGDKVRVKGTVAEYGDSTVGTGTLTELTSVSVSVCNAGNSVTPASVTLPETINGDLERYEGMLVSVASAMTVSQDYFVGRYGQMTLSSGGRMYQPTNQFLPGSAEAIALAAENARRTLILDDGMALDRCGDNPNPAPYLGSGPAVIRAGDSVSNLVGVLDYGQIDSGETGGCSTAGTLFTGDYRLHPTVAPTFTPVNTRPDTPPAVGGNIKVVSANTLNFFNGDGAKGGFPTSRGASNFTEFVRQRIKFYESLSRLNADVVGLAEIENDGFGATSAIAEIVKVLNEGPCWNSATECAALGYTSSGMGAGTYAFVNPGGTAVGTDEITVGIIYKPGRVTPVGTAVVLTAAEFTDPRNSGTQKSRPAIAQTFEENTWGERFTAVANHLKSKGSECNTVSNTNDDDVTTGQGNCNGTRTDGAYYQVNTWIPTLVTTSGDPDVLVIGDMNAYAREDPITQYLNAGYVDLPNAFGGSTAYSYIFDGQSGYLDHALSSAALRLQVVGAADWHTNADEPTVIDYNTEFNPTNYYAPNQYRSADHDPVLVGLGLYPDLSDLATYGQAWHTGQGTPWKLGAGWTGDSSSGTGTDTDDGVARDYAESWNDTRGEVRVTVTGPAGKWACLNAWLDYSDGTVVANTVETPNNAFDANEHVVNNRAIQAGANQLVTWPLEQGVINAAATYNMRFRLVPDPNNDGACGDVALVSAAAVLAPDGGALPTGRADGGEVEDYAFQPGPLAVTLASFTAATAADGVTLAWETISETDNAGFNIYRADSEAGPWVRVNAMLIPAAAPGSSGGHAYTWTDATAAANTAYVYRLEAVALDGTATLLDTLGVTYRPAQRLWLPLVR